MIIIKYLGLMATEEIFHALHIDTRCLYGQCNNSKSYTHNHFQHIACFSRFIFSKLYALVVSQNGQYISSNNNRIVLSQTSQTFNVDEEQQKSSTT